MSLPDRDLIARFLEMLAAEQGVAKNTLLAYQSDLMSASDLLHGKLTVAGPDALVELARQWRDLANSSVARKASALRRFFAFLHEEGFRADNPSAALPKPAQMRPLPKILDKDEVDTLFAVIEAKLLQAHPIANDYRLSALIELLYGSGLRATELVALPRNAVVSDRPFIIIKG
jgi:integrase/recombinase XerD